MAFKKHQPRRTRGPIRRDYCPYCDGYGTLDEICPPFLADIDGNRLPFSVRTYLSAGWLMTVFKYPDKQYIGFAQPETISFDASCSDPWAMDAQKKSYEPQKWAHVTKAGYCPKCGRDLNSSRPRFWRRNG